MENQERTGKMNQEVLVVSRAEADGNPILHTAVMPSFEKDVVVSAILSFAEQWYEHKTKAEMRKIANLAYEEMVKDGYCWIPDGLCFTRGGSVLPYKL